jgi:uncharacterized protein
MTARPDLLRLALKLVVYISLYLATAFVLGPLTYYFGGYMVAITTTGLLAATVSNGLCMRIYASRGIAAIGLLWDRASLVNLGWGLLGGMGAAVIVLAGALLVRAARLEHASDAQPTLGSFLFVMLVLLFGAAGEEMLFRGFGFQILLRNLGEWTTILPVGVVFAALHARNPNSTWLSLVNTAGFGILFGYAFLRSRDLWLPIGLHFGWNFTLPLFGVNISGLTMRTTGYSMEWSVGALWSGGAYGPEASILTSGVLLVLLAYLRKAPIRRQASVLVDPPAGEATCESG